MNRHDPRRGRPERSATAITRAIWADHNPASASPEQWQVYADALMEVEPLLGEHIGLHLALETCTDSHHYDVIRTRIEEIESYETLWSYDMLESWCMAWHPRLTIHTDWYYGLPTRLVLYPSAETNQSCKRIGTLLNHRIMSGLHCLQIEPIGLQSDSHLLYDFLLHERWPTLRKLVLVDPRTPDRWPRLRSAMPWLQEFVLSSEELPDPNTFAELSRWSPLKILHLDFALVSSWDFLRLLKLLASAPLPLAETRGLTVDGDHLCAPAKGLSTYTQVLAEFTEVQISAHSLDLPLARALEAHPQVKVRLW